MLYSSIYRLSSGNQSPHSLFHCRPDWSKSSIKMLVARLKATGGDTGAVYSRKRYFTAVSGAQVDDLKAELPTLPRVSVAVVTKKLGTSSSTAWRVLHKRLEKRPADLTCCPSPSPCVLSLYPSQAWCSAPLLQGALLANIESAAGLLQRRKGPQSASISSTAKLQALGGTHPGSAMDCADLLRTDRSQSNPGIMVAMVVGWNGIASMHFAEPVKVNSAYYCEHTLTQC